MKRRYMVVLILFLIIGFASISTTLVISGVIGTGTKNNDFKVIFTGAILDGIDKSNILISDDKIRIDYETEKLWKINDTSVLEFEVTNTSTQYDANVVLECDEINHEAIDFSITPSTMEIKPNEVKTGNITIALNRAVYTENIKINFSCRLKATAGEKTKAEVIEEINNLYNVSGNLQRSDGTPINSENLVVYSEKKNIKTDLSTGYFYISGLEKGFHHIYKVPSELTEYEEEDIQEYMIAEIATNGYIKVYDENYKIVNYESSQDLEDNGNYCPYEIGKVWNIDNSNGETPFSVECNGKYKIELWGASGGSLGSGIAGQGAYVSGDIDLNSTISDTIYINIGGTTDGITGGYNGGGDGRVYYHLQGQGGGGSTDVRIISKIDANFSYKSLHSRILVAAGGGGGYQDMNSSNVHSNGGSAGGLIGYNGTNCYNYELAIGASQISHGHGFSDGLFGNGGNSTGYDYDGNDSQAGGGGGGYFGGGAGRYPGGGAGGSSFISGHLGCVAIKDPLTTNSVTIRNASDELTECTEELAKIDIECSKHYSGYVFTNTKMIDGKGYSWTNNISDKEAMPKPSGGYYDEGVGHSGDGFARITLLSYESQ